MPASPATREAEKEVFLLNLPNTSIAKEKDSRPNEKKNNKKSSKMVSATSMLYIPLSALWNIDPCVLYPIRGMQYFATHPALWGNLMLLALPQITLTVVVAAIAYAFLFPPQAALAFILNGPAGVVGSSIGMFQQSMSIVRSVSELFLFPKPLRILFDGVLVQEGMDRVILQGRMSSPQQFDQSDYQRIASWFKSLPRKLLFPSWLMMVLLRFFLSFIPLLGPVVLIVLDAPGTAGRCLGRYFELKGWDQPHIDAFVNRNRWQWYSFGLIAATLETIPFIGFVFSFTNTAGGALWAVRIERMGLLRTEPVENKKKWRNVLRH